MIDFQNIHYSDTNSFSEFILDYLNGDFKDSLYSKSQKIEGFEKQIFEKSNHFIDRKLLVDVLYSQNKNFSRPSITMHAIPQSHKFLQFHSRKMYLQTDDLENSLIYRPKDQSKLKNRLILKFETHFPSFFYWLKKQAIKFLIGNK